MQGISIAECFLGTPGQTTGPALAEAVKSGPVQRALYQDNFKLVQFDATKKTDLYNISKDPMELTELGISQPEFVKKLNKTLNEMISENDRRSERIRENLVEIDDQQLRQLQSLGYMEDTGTSVHR